MDRRVAKYAGWLEELYNRPYIKPLAEKWIPIFKQRLSEAFQAQKWGHMAYTTINGRNSQANFTIDFGAGPLSYKCIFSTFLIDATTDQIPSSTFCSEPNEEFEPGNTTIVVTVAGLLKKGTGASGQPAGDKLILIPPPQKTPIVAQYDVGCTIGFTANFRRATANRVANQNSVMTGEAFSTGVIAVVWA
jgi:hypothetical protein